jgi:hypothetical protein
MRTGLDSYTKLGWPALAQPFAPLKSKNHLLRAETFCQRTAIWPGTADVLRPTASSRRAFRQPPTPEKCR